jgi:serine/threonine protein kinase
VKSRSSIYELLTGRVPFVGRTTEEVFDRQLSYPPPPLDRFAPDVLVPAGLEEVLRKALAKRPAARYSSMTELAAALKALGG